MILSPILNYKLLGLPSNPVLLIIHGLFGSLDNWMTLGKKWSENYCVILIDVRNHGKSFHSDYMTFEHIIDDIELILNKENIQSISILGHSMGGKIAMEYAAQFPEKIEKMIVVDVAPFPYSAHHSQVFEMIHAIDLTQFNNRDTIVQAISKYIKEPEVVQFMMKNIKRDETTLLFEWKFNAPILELNYLYLIQRVVNKGIKKEVLFIGGAQSDYISSETSTRIFDLYPNVTIDFVSNAGHWVHADNPNEFFDKVSTFLA